MAKGRKNRKTRVNNYTPTQVRSFYSVPLRQQVTWNPAVQTIHQAHDVAIKRAHRKEELNEVVHYLRNPLAAIPNQMRERALVCSRRKLRRIAILSSGKGGSAVRRHYLNNKYRDVRC